MSDVRIKVDTGKLVKQAGNIKKNIQSFRKEWNALKTAAENTKTYWEGDASNKHGNMLSKTVEEVEEVINRLSEHPDDLLKMANLYVEGEKASEEIAKSLPKDVIV